MVEFNIFKQELKGDVVEPSSPEYSAAIARWAVNSERKARYVVFPKDEADITTAIKFATSNKIPLAVKCGGHNPSGTSSITDGLCIDLHRYFNTARVDVDKKLVYVGGGALWDTVDRTVIAHGFGTPGGTVNHTGVAGLILGGGYGWLSGEHGLAIDNLVQATVVIADGSVVTASSTSHPDLFWGIRGGGSNFGVVTEFVLKVHNQRKTVFAGAVIFPPPVIPKLFEVADEWWSTIGDKEGAMISLTRGPGRQPVVVLLIFYNGSEAEGRANFKRFYDLGPVADFASEIPYENLNGMINENAKPGRRVYMSNTSLRSRAAAHGQKVFEHMVALTEKHPENPELPPFDAMVGYEYFSLNNVRTVPSDAMAFNNRGPEPNVLLAISWDNEEEGGADVQHARDISNQFIKIIDSTAESKDSGNQGYGNYVTDQGEMGKVQKLWGKNYPKLQRIKKEYDPNLVFNRWFPVQPAA